MELNDELEFDHSTIDDDTLELVDECDGDNDFAGACESSCYAQKRVMRNNGRFEMNRSRSIRQRESKNNNYGIERKRQRVRPPSPSISCQQQPNKPRWVSSAKLQQSSTRKISPAGPSDVLFNNNFVMMNHSDAPIAAPSFGHKSINEEHFESERSIVERISIVKPSAGMSRSGNPFFPFRPVRGRQNETSLLNVPPEKIHEFIVSGQHRKQKSDINNTYYGKYEIHTSHDPWQSHYYHQQPAPLEEGEIMSDDAYCHNELISNQHFHQQKDGVTDYHQSHAFNDVVFGGIQGQFPPDYFDSEINTQFHNLGQPIPLNLLRIPFQEISTEINLRKGHTPIVVERNFHDQDDEQDFISIQPPQQHEDKHEKHLNEKNEVVVQMDNIIIVASGSGRFTHLSNDSSSILGESNAQEYPHNPLTVSSHLENNIPTHAISMDICLQENQTTINKQPSTTDHVDASSNPSAGPKTNLTTLVAARRNSLIPFDDLSNIDQFDYFSIKSVIVTVLKKTLENSKKDGCLLTDEDSTDEQNCRLQTALKNLIINDCIEKIIFKKSATAFVYSQLTTIQKLESELRLRHRELKNFDQHYKEKKEVLTKFKEEMVIKEEQHQKEVAALLNELKLRDTIIENFESDKCVAETFKANLNMKDKQIKELKHEIHSLQQKEDDYKTKTSLASEELDSLKVSQQIAMIQKEKAENDLEDIKKKLIEVSKNKEPLIKKEVEETRPKSSKSDEWYYKREGSSSSPDDFRKKYDKVKEEFEKYQKKHQKHEKVLKVGKIREQKQYKQSKELIEQNAKLNELKECSTQKEKLDGTISSIKKHIIYLRKQRDETINSNSELKTSLDAANRKIIDMEAINKRQNETVAQLQSENEDERSALNTLVSDYRRRLEEASNTIQQLRSESLNRQNQSDNSIARHSSNSNLQEVISSESKSKEVLIKISNIKQEQKSYY